MVAPIGEIGFSGYFATKISQNSPGTPVTSAGIPGVGETDKSPGIGPKECRT